MYWLIRFGSRFLQWLSKNWKEGEQSKTRRDFATAYMLGLVWSRVASASVYWSHKGSALIRMPCSPDLMVPDFFLLGYFKSGVYETKLHNFEILKNQIRAEISQIPKAILENVYHNWVFTLRLCVATDGKHWPDTIF